MGSNEEEIDDINLQNPEHLTTKKRNSLINFFSRMFADDENDIDSSYRKEKGTKNSGKLSNTTRINNKKERNRGSPRPPKNQNDLNNGDNNDDDEDGDDNDSSIRTKKSNSQKSRQKKRKLSSKGI